MTRYPDLFSWFAGLICLGLLSVPSPVCGAQASQVAVQVRVEVPRSLQVDLGMTMTNGNTPRWQQITDLVAVKIADKLNRSNIPMLKFWSFGVSESPYRVVLRLQEARVPRKRYKLFVELIRGVEPSEMVSHDGKLWCDLSAEANSDPVCNLRRLVGSPPQSIAGKIADSFEVLMNEAPGRLTDALKEKLEKSMPIADGITWYDARLHAPLKERDNARFSVVTNLDWGKFNGLAQGKASYLSCIGPDFLLEIEGQWLPEPVKPKGKSQGYLGAHFRNWISLNLAEPQPLRGSICGERNRRRQVSLRPSGPYYRTAEEKR